MLSIKNLASSLLIAGVMAITPIKAYANNVYLPVVISQQTQTYTGTVTAINLVPAGLQITLVTADNKFILAQSDKVQDSAIWGNMIGRLVSITGRFTSNGVLFASEGWYMTDHRVQTEFQICHNSTSGCAQFASQQTEFYEDGSAVVIYAHIKYALCVDPALGCSADNNDPTLEIHKISDGRYSVTTGN